MTPPAAAATAAPVVSSTPMVLRYDGNRRELDCLYVQVDAKSRADVADFLAGWRSCCTEVGIDWQTVRRPQSALVGLELRRCCSPTAASLRIVFDVRRDSDALDTLVRTESIVVGNRPYGGFANVMVAFGVDGRGVERAVRAARGALQSQSAIAS